MAAPEDAWSAAVTLEGKRFRLEPLAAGHLGDLAAVAFEPRIWRWMPSQPADVDALRAWLEQALANAARGTEVPFATVDRASGRAIGSTRFLNILPEHRRLEIGYTWLGTQFQRSGANREAKRLQLEHAFGTLGANRVEFKTDSLNEPSRTALLGLGAIFEGILRNHMIMPGGRLRHSAYYSILAEEWPAVRARLNDAAGDR